MQRGSGDSTIIKSEGCEKKITYIACNASNIYCVWLIVRVWLFQPPFPCLCGLSLTPDVGAYAHTVGLELFLCLTIQNMPGERVEPPWTWGAAALLQQPFWGPSLNNLYPEQSPGNSGSAKSWSGATNLDQSRIMWFSELKVPLDFI